MDESQYVEAWDWSKKVASARWFQRGDVTAPLLAAGSWGAVGCEQLNGVGVWAVPVHRGDEGLPEFCSVDAPPELQCEAPMCGDVTELMPLELPAHMGVVACSSSGRVRRFTLGNLGRELALTEELDVHKQHAAPATSLHMFESRLASASEDGSIFLSDLAAVVPSVIELCQPGAAPINAVRFRSAEQLLVVGSCASAQLQLWDTRSGTVAQRFRDTSAVTTSYQCIACDGMSVSCGTSDGSVVLWDLRAPRERMFAARVHRGAVRDLCRHGKDSLLSCGDDGRVAVSCLGAGEKFHVQTGLQEQRTTTSKALKSSDVTKWGGIGANVNLPMNSLDVHQRSNMVAAASDAQFFVCLQASAFAVGRSS